MNILIIYGSNSSEKEVSIKTGIAVHSALDGLFNSKMLMLNDDYKIVKDHYKKGDLIVCMEDTARMVRFSYFLRKRKLNLLVQVLIHVI